MLCGPAAPAADPPKPVAIGSLQATPPADWKAEKPANRLRSHQFRLPSGEDGVADGEVNVRPQSSPKPEKEFPRWKAEFVPPDGKTIEDVAKETAFDVSEAKVHVLDVTGTWKYKKFPQAKKEEQRPGYRVVWVIVVGKDEATHIRLSGPSEVVEKYKKGFDDWLKALK
jgi:hypothetical protein